MMLRHPRRHGVRRGDKAKLVGFQSNESQRFDAGLIGFQSETSEEDLARALPRELGCFFDGCRAAHRSRGECRFIGRSTGHRW